MRGTGPLYDELHELGLERSSHHGPPFFAALPPVLRDRGVAQQLIVTTGYDLALEEAFLEAGEEFDLVVYLAAGRDRGKFCHVSSAGEKHVIDVPNRYATELDIQSRPVILKLHGGVDPAPDRARETFVITEDDYIDYLPQSSYASAVPVGLAVELRRRQFLFSRVRDGRLEPPSRAQPAVGRKRAAVALLGRRASYASHRAGILARSRGRPLRGPAR